LEIGEPDRNGSVNELYKDVAGPKGGRTDRATICGSGCGITASTNEQEVTMIGYKTFSTFLLASALGALGIASAVASEHSTRGDRGGFVVPGSLDGVNPAYHPDIFGNPAVAAAYGFEQSRDGVWHVRDRDWRR
jgi:hypothetical protein